MSAFEVLTMSRTGVDPVGDRFLLLNRGRSIGEDVAELGHSHPGPGQARGEWLELGPCFLRTVGIGSQS